MDPDRYKRKIAEGLSGAFDASDTEEITVDADTARLVFFSDHHRGSRDLADDFMRCEPAYAAALGYYLEAGYHLFVLGDGEELWECPAKEVLPSYQDILRLEAEFHAAGRYDRFLGNHDDLWGSPRQVAKHLESFFPGLEIREALKVRVTTGGEPGGLLFLVHGHQGTLESDRFSFVARLVVRHIWRPLQRRLGIASTTPSRDHELRASHDSAMFEWAREHPARPVLVAGHTHRPVFGTSRPQPKAPRSSAEVQREFDALRASPEATPEKVARLRAELELVRGEERRADPPPRPVSPPCYFNTGCCSFGDGDVTGIELTAGELRLVRWPDDDDRPLPKVLARAKIADVLREVASR
jgi:hypothetical protein